MKNKKIGINVMLFGLIFCALLYFSNNFGLIDIEKTAIITAIGLDTAENEYEVTVQIAVPQASNATKENDKAVISATGATASEALHQIGDITGWYPNLGFCNLIVLGEDLLVGDVNVCVDYFSKTLKLQDSACLTACEGKAKDLLKAVTPLDSISSFAIQKILLKNPGMTSDVATVDVKTFSVGYFSNAASSHMPFIRAIEVGGAKSGKAAGEGEEQSGGGSQEPEMVFDAAYTAMFKDGYFVGMLDDHETKTFNVLNEKVNENFFIVDDVPIGENRENFLLNVSDNKCKVKLDIENGVPVLKVNARLFVRVEDRTAYQKEEALKSNALLPEPVAKKAQEDFVKYMLGIVKKCRESGCDLLELDNKLYRHHHKEYERMRRTLYDDLQLRVNVEFSGVK